MKIQVNKPSFMGNSLRITSAIVLCIGASLIIPKIAGAAGRLNRVVPEYSIDDGRNNLGERQVNPQDSLSGYEPPDFGRPESAYGSGTR